MVYIVVYVGAIAILFLFVVMMLNIKLLEVKEHFWIYTPVALFLASLVLLEIISILVMHAPQDDFSLYYDPILYPVSSEYSSDLKNHPDMFMLLSSIPSLSIADPTKSDPITNTLSYTDWVSLATLGENIQSIGFVMYSYYYFPFILSAVLLFVAMLGSIVLTIRDMHASKRQDAFSQIQGEFSTSINLK